MQGIRSDREVLRNEKALRYDLVGRKRCIRKRKKRRNVCFQRVDAQSTGTRPLHGGKIIGIAGVAELTVHTAEKGFGQLGHTEYSKERTMGPR